MDQPAFMKEYWAYLDAIERYMMMKGKDPKVVLQFEDGRRHETVTLLQDISAFRFKLVGQPADQAGQEEDDHERDDELRRKINQYNQATRPAREKEGRERRSRRQGEGKGEGHKRKIRTTITQAKLDEMNMIFSKYQEYREAHKDVASDDQEDSKFEYGSLKAIGEKLGLGYSTILHKYREYRATKKVKGGALIAAMHHKRKYKKSQKIEEYIRQALKVHKFYTAVELSKYIEEQHGEMLSRSIISRHLGEMGYSYKNIKSKPTSNKNSTTIKEFRTQFSTAVKYMRDHNDARIYHLDECIFPFADYVRTEDPDTQRGEDLVLLVLIGQEGVVKAQPILGPATEYHYILFLGSASDELKIHGSECIILLDMDNKAHTTVQMAQMRTLLREDRIRLYFQPPNSYQLNAVEWLMSRLKQAVASTPYNNSQELQAGAQGCLKEVSAQTIQTCLRESEEYLNKAIHANNF